MRPVREHYQEALLRSRSLMLFDADINSNVSERIITGLLMLDALSKEPIYLYINSYGQVTEYSYSTIFAIYDVMNVIQSPVYTICLGVAYGGAALLLAAGKKRYISVNSEVVLSQPMGTVSGTVADVTIHAERLKEQKAEFIRVLAKHTGKPAEEIEKYIDRMFILDAKGALEYGIVDEVLGG